MLKKKKITVKAGQAGISKQWTLYIDFWIFCFSVPHLYIGNKSISISQKYYKGQFINDYTTSKIIAVRTCGAKVNGELNIEIHPEF